MSGAPHTPLSIGRLTARPEFLACARGFRVAHDGVVVQAVRSDRAGAGARAGFTATKKIGGAVARNRAKRRLREAARQTLPALGRAGCAYVFIARAGTGARPWPALLDDVQSALISLARLLDREGSGHAVPADNDRAGPRPAKS